MYSRRVSGYNYREEAPSLLYPVYKLSKACVTNLLRYEYGNIDIPPIPT